MAREFVLQCNLYVLNRSDEDVGLLDPWYVAEVIKKSRVQLQERSL